MKALKILITIIAIYTLTSHVSNAQVKEGEDVFYEIFVRSFYDSNKDGIGDINGVTQKLDYLKELGITGLWLTTIHQSPTYHKYDVTNYLSIDPEYGTIDDYKNLITQAHQRGIKILLDLVVNHTSTNHPWFKKAVKGEMPYRNYYIWNTDSTSKGWYTIKGNKIKNEKYYGFFWKGMPDLNYDFPLVRSEIINAGKYWLQMGVDGFRLDAAQHIYDATEISKNIEWWTYFKTEMKTINPNVFLLGEVWNKDVVVAQYLEKSLNSCFNFDLSNAIPDAIKKGNGNELLNKLIEIRKLYTSYNKFFIDATFLTNHDQDRIFSILDQDTAKTKLSAFILLTLPGTPFIYYGEEMAMAGKFPDPLRREPMLWKSGKKSTGNTYWEKSIYNNSKTSKPLDLLRKETDNFFDFYKNLISLRANSDILKYGSLTSVDNNNNDLMIYQRTYQNRSMIIVHNMTSKTQTYMRPNMSKIFYISSHSKPIENAMIELAPYESVILTF